MQHKRFAHLYNSKHVFYYRDKQYITDVAFLQAAGVYSSLHSNVVYKTNTRTVLIQKIYPKGI